MQPHVTRRPNPLPLPTQEEVPATLTLTPPTPVPTSFPKSAITLHSALLSTLRAWLVFRDEALWAFCSGTEPADPLELLSCEQCVVPILAANRMRDTIRDLAKQISEEGDGKAVALVIREAITELLATESPRFLLAVPHIPGSF